MTVPTSSLMMASALSLSKRSNASRILASVASIHSCVLVSMVYGIWYMVYGIWYEIEDGLDGLEDELEDRRAVLARRGARG
jgi:hypothetical protein